MQPKIVRNLSYLTSVLIAIAGGSLIIYPDLIFSSQEVVAQNPNRQTNTHKPRQKGWLRELELTPEQMQKIREIRRNSQPKLQQQRLLVRQKQQELQTLMAGNKPSTEVREKYHQLKSLRQQIQETQFENTLLIRDVLNPEQRQKFTERMYKKQKEKQEQNQSS